MNEQLEKNEKLEKTIQEYEREIINLKRGNEEEKDLLLQLGFFLSSFSILPLFFGPLNRRWIITLAAAEWKNFFFLLPRKAPFPLVLIRSNLTEKILLPSS